jgi:protein involved in polysaccharide export with SLBB domain
MMKKLLIVFLFLGGTMLQAEQSSDYILDAGDQIRILVYDEPDLTVERFITDDGKINFPLVGSVYVTGKTTRQVQQIIHDGLKGDYLLHPSVQVDIITYRPFYIHGEVNRPGAYPYQPGLTVDQAVALGGGFTERASTSKMYIKKAYASEKSRKKVSLTYSVEPGDTITIEQSFF